ncbi:uncharacterized protein ASPGLDRAFT_45204 [Aspergillus glaucus CBS 516.65]|uniref:Uncharacterized protein n=1 Tax=Aspergillus glaucus CBS 516.65 TaxID=1160497 RepID=A0A1L9VQH2_ASPGL|nr:hypothetical protein ASPGLDRAFT_45204 [Aspergillus glaucus CBS 516.65]OJJ86165.1 hypothetical protein ASPGLDRAFT_45204 [Aspergillus glaucus CBS 516.65]
MERTLKSANAAIPRPSESLVPSRLWNQLNAPVDVASKTYAMFSSTVPTRQDPGCAILHRDQGGSWITGPT